MNIAKTAANAPSPDLCPTEKRGFRESSREMADGFAAALLALAGIPGVVTPPVAPPAAIPVSVVPAGNDGDGTPAVTRDNPAHPLVARGGADVDPVSIAGDSSMTGKDGPAVPVAVINPAETSLPDGFAVALPASVSPAAAPGSGPADDHALQTAAGAATPGAHRGRDAGVSPAAGDSLSGESSSRGQPRDEEMARPRAPDPAALLGAVPETPASGPAERPGNPVLDHVGNPAPAAGVAIERAAAPVRDGGQPASGRHFSEVERTDPTRARLSSGRAELVVGDGNDRIALVVSTSGSQVRVVGTTASPGLAADLQAGAGDLARALVEHGLQLDQMALGTGSQQGNSDRDRRTSEPARASTGKLDDEDEIPPEFTPRSGLRVIA